MTIVFDHEEVSVYIENPDPASKESRLYYYRWSGNDKAEGQAIVSLMRRMHNLGKQHRSEEIRKALGV